MSRVDTFYNVWLLYVVGILIIVLCNGHFDKLIPRKKEWVLFPEMKTGIVSRIYNDMITL